MRFKNKIIKTTLITFSFAWIVSCSHRKIIGEHIGIHYNYYSNLRPTPPTETKAPPFTTDSAGFLKRQDRMTPHCIIAIEERVKEKTIHSLFIDKKLNVIVEVRISNEFNHLHIEYEPQFTYFGKGEVIDDKIQVSFHKKEERGVHGSFCTYFYEQPFVIDYLITKNNDEIDCILFYFDAYNTPTYYGIDKEIWTNEYWLYTPKQIRKRDKTWKN